jgi:hypothetical protein
MPIRTSGEESVTGGQRKFRKLNYEPVFDEGRRRVRAGKRLTRNGTIHSNWQFVSGSVPLKLQKGIPGFGLTENFSQDK